MTDTPKMFAPKPIKASSNVNGVRLINNFEKIKNVQFNSYTPKLEKNKMEITTHSKFTGRLFDMAAPGQDKLENFQLSKKGSLFEVHWEEDKTEIPLFENILRKDFGVFKNECEDLKSKSEILSILRNGNGSMSTNYSNFYQSENLDFNPNTSEHGDFFIIDDLRTSMPPIRSHNPLCRNFDLGRNALPRNTLENECLNELDLSFSQIGICYDPK